MTTIGTLAAEVAQFGANYDRALSLLRGERGPIAPAARAQLAEVTMIYAPLYRMIGGTVSAAVANDAGLGAAVSTAAPSEVSWTARAWDYAQRAIAAVAVPGFAPFALYFKTPTDVVGAAVSAASPDAGGIFFSTNPDGSRAIRGWVWAGLALGVAFYVGRLS